MPIEQVNVTRNQSTLKVTLEHIFLFDNRYDERTLNNTTAAAEITLKAGNLLFKNAAGTVDVLDAAANIANIVGILALGDEVALANAASLDINMGVQGTVNEDLIILPGGVTFDTVIPTTTRTLRDHLNSIGFHLEKPVENTKFDNV